MLNPRRWPFGTVSLRINKERWFALAGAIATGLILSLEFNDPALRALRRNEPAQLLLLSFNKTTPKERPEHITLLRIEPALPAIKILSLPTQGANFNAPSSCDAAALNAYLQKFLPSATPQPQCLSFTYDESGNLNQWGAQILKNPWMTPLWLAGLKRKNRLAAPMSLLEMLALWYRIKSYMDAPHIFFFAMPTASSPTDAFADDVQAVNWDGHFRFGTNGLSAQPVRLEILNATTQPGLAQLLTRALRQTQTAYDVLYFGNTTPAQDAKNYLITRDAPLALAKHVWVSLNKKMDLRLTHLVAPDKNRGVHFSIVLGDSAISDKIKKVNPWEGF